MCLPVYAVSDCILFACHNGDDVAIGTESWRHLINEWSQTNKSVEMRMIDIVPNLCMYENIFCRFYQSQQNVTWVGCWCMYEEKPSKQKRNNAIEQRHWATKFLSFVYIFMRWRMKVISLESTAIYFEKICASVNNRKIECLRETENECLRDKSELRLIHSIMAPGTHCYAKTQHFYSLITCSMRAGL